MRAADGRREANHSERTSAYRLITLGGLALQRSDGSPEPSLSTRRRKLALLTYLAVRGAPVPRGVLADVFWGERDEERARNSLSDALSHLRRVLGSGIIEAYAADVSVNRAALPSVDVFELLDAAASGDHSRVLALYRGPFLHGVYITGSSAFEDWSSRERDRIDDLFAASCEAECARLADTAEWRVRAGIAQRWLDVRPTSDAAAVHLLEALRTPSSRDALIAARDAYERYRARLAVEYDLPAGAEVERVARQIAETLRSAERLPSPFVPAQPVAPSSPAGPSARAAGPRSFRLPVFHPLSRPARVATLVLAVVGVVSVAAVAAGRDTGPSRAAAAAANPRPTVAIAPILIGTRDPALAWLEHGLPAMVLDRLSYVSGVEPVRGTPPDQAAGVMPNIDVTAFGTLMRHDSMLVLQLSLRDARGRIIGREALFATSPAVLAERVAVRLLHAVDAGSTISALGDEPLGSVRQYQLLTEAARITAVDGPVSGGQKLDEAIALDSSFLAAVFARLRIALERNQAAAAEALLPVVRANYHRASEWDRLHFDLQDALTRGDVSRAGALALALVQRYPNNYETYGTAAGVLFRQGRFDDVDSLLSRGLARWTGPPEAGTIQFYCGFLRERGYKRCEIGNSAGGLNDLRQAVRVCPTIANYGALSHSLLAAGRLDEARDSWTVLESLGERSRWLPGRILLRARDWPAIDTFVGRQSRTNPGDARELYYTALREQGRFREAADSMSSAEGADGYVPLVHLHSAARAGDRALVRRLAAGLLHPMKPELSLLGDTIAFAGSAVRGWAWHRAVYADAVFGLGDTATVRALADSLALFGPRSSYGRDWRVHHHLRGLLHARAGRHEDAVREFRQALWIPAGWTRTNVELARSYLALGRPHDAVAILRQAYGGNFDSMARYATQSELDYGMAHAFAAAGLADSAAVYAAHVRRAWRRADPPVRALLDSLPVFSRTAARQQRPGPRQPRPSR